MKGGGTEVVEGLNIRVSGWLIMPRRSPEVQNELNNTQKNCSLSIKEVSRVSDVADFKTILSSSFSLDAWMKLGELCGDSF